ncbi:MAG TPA: HEAT repeat domain-containing protein [Polyangiaceae bacterium]|jgi:HEAT repeat protein
MKHAFLAGSLVALLATATAGAQNKPPQVQVSKTAAADLKSSDGTKIRAALDEVRLAGKTAGAPYVASIVALLDRGMTPELTTAAIDTLADLEAQPASQAIAEYMQHRSVRVRQSAVKALGKTKGPAAVRGLVKGLSDQDGMVRGVAANALGQLKAKSAVPDLFLALDHRVNEAATSIGMLCDPADCEKLGARIGKIPFDVASAGVEQVLFRTDVGDDTKIKLVGRIRELGTREANKFLAETTKKWPQKGSARIKQALDQAVQATGGGS